MGRSCPVTELPWTELLLAADWGSQPKKGTEAWTAWKSLTEHRPVRPNYGGAKVISWDALEVTMWKWIFREPGFSTTNGKKWFPKGYKVTTQNRCAEKKMRKWFCENNGSDPAHPKHTTLLVLTPKATRPHRFDSVALPKPQQKANTPQAGAIPSFLYKCFKECAVVLCLPRLPSTHLSLSSLTNERLAQLWPSVRSTPYLLFTVSCSVGLSLLLSKANPVGWFTWVVYNNF